MAAVHFPLVFMSLWSVKLEEEVTVRIGTVAGLVTLILAELASVWYNALFIMSFLYIALGVLHNLLKGRLFSRTSTEYSLVAGFVILLFWLVFPWK